MAFASFETDPDNAPLADINMVPLIDVMLVLLIIFMVTAPLLTHAVKLELPRASSQPNTGRPDSVQIAIDPHGQVFWNAQAVDAATLADRMHAAAQLAVPPELHISADRATPYEKVAQTMSLAASQGLNKIGFVTEPHRP